MNIRFDLQATADAHFTYPQPTVNDKIVRIQERISYFIPHSIYI